jgi:hypothetical protein
MNVTSSSGVRGPATALLSTLLMVVTLLVAPARAAAAEAPPVADLREWAVDLMRFDGPNVARAAEAAWSAPTRT